MQVTENLTDTGNDESRVVQWRFNPPPDTKGGSLVAFRLVYQGRLPAASNRYPRGADKHHIRQQFHRQLKRLWDTDPFLGRLRAYPKVRNIDGTTDPPVVASKSWLDYTADNFSRFGYRFVPLISEESGQACSLDILFLRRDYPGVPLIAYGGDIDNRLKVLFDALRMPHKADEDGGVPPGLDENPFFCLMEDDKLLVDVKVTTDRLLTPEVGPESVSDVYLVIHVSSVLVSFDDSFVQRF